MPFYSGSSRPNSISGDGSRMVFCYMCHAFIGRTFESIQRALCEMCRRVENGEPITEAAIREYELGKLGNANVSLLELTDNIPEPAKKFTLRSMTGEFMSALNFLMRKKPDAVKAKAVARSKRRPPLFSAVQLGNMQEIDEKLKNGDN